MILASLEKLAKVNNKSPLDLAQNLIQIIRKNDDQIDNITSVKPGFINIKFKSIFWNNFTKEVLENIKTFGINKKEKKKKLSY